MVGKNGVCAQKPVVLEVSTDNVYVIALQHRMVELLVKDLMKNAKIVITQVALVSYCGAV